MTTDTPPEPRPDPSGPRDAPKVTPKAEAGTRPPRPPRPARPYRQGVMRRMANTPVRDYARGRLSGRLDVGHLLRTSSLPATLRTLVADVVRRTRLWRMERADVAVELISHFRDGLAAGESADALVAAFGSPRRTAALIRRAKRRGRPWLWKAGVRSVQIAGIVLAIFVGLYLVATALLFTGRPTIAHDYLAELNAAAAAVPQEQRAWPMYREALLRLGELPPVVAGRGVRPGQVDWDEAAAWLEQHAETLRLVRDAARQPGLGYVVGPRYDPADRELWPQAASTANDAELVGGMAAALLQFRVELRKLGDLLALDALRAAELGDGALAAENVVALLGISEHAREVPALPNELTALRQVSLAVGTLAAILSEQPEIFSDDELRRLAHELVALQGGRIEVRLDGERLWARDLIQHLYTDDGEGDGRLTARGLQSLAYVGDGSAARLGPFAPAVGVVLAGRREMTDEFARWFALIEAEAGKPLWRQDPMRIERELNRVSGSAFYTARYFPVPLLMRSLVHVGVEPQLVIQERDALCTAIALELHRRRHGSWPESLADLVPDLLPWAPPDRFDGAPLRYRLVDGQPQLYSVGADRDDDGGRAGARARLARFGADADGDWILWPPSADPRDADGSQRAELPVENAETLKR